MNDQVIQKSNFMLKLLNDSYDNKSLAETFPDFYYVSVAICNMISNSFSVGDIDIVEVTDIDHEEDAGSITIVLDVKKSILKDIKEEIAAANVIQGVKKHKYRLKPKFKGNVLFISYKRK